MSVTEYKVRSPLSGHWLAGPMLGVTAHAEDAHPYREDDLHLHNMIRLTVHNGMKLRLRPVATPRPEADLEAAFERDIEASPAPRYVECPDCEGWGVDCQDDPYPCKRCDGAGRVPEAESEPHWIDCPECRGTGDSRERPFYPCNRCHGRGAVNCA